MMLPADLRQQVIARDGLRCRYCGIKVVRRADYPYWPPIPNHMAGVGLLTIDHIRPRSRGGFDELSNLCVACQECNVKKGSFHRDYLQKQRRKKRKARRRGFRS